MRAGFVLFGAFLPNSAWMGHKFSFPIGISSNDIVRIGEQVVFDTSCASFLSFLSFLSFFKFRSLAWFGRPIFHRDRDWKVRKTSPTSHAISVCGYID